MENENILLRFLNTFMYVMDTPTTFIKEKIVAPNQKKYPWYHQKFRRVPTVDECYIDDVVCYAEAQDQMIRDKLVDNNIVTILRGRYEDCVIHNGNEDETCKKIYETYLDTAGAWFTKYGDTVGRPKVSNVYMKQKHRMIWERRYGPVGTVPEEKIFEIIDE